MTTTTSKTGKVEAKVDQAEADPNGKVYQAEVDPNGITTLAEGCVYYLVIERGYGNNVYMTCKEDGSGPNFLQEKSDSAEGIQRQQFILRRVSGAWAFQVVGGVQGSDVYRRQYLAVHVNLVHLASNTEIEKGLWTLESNGIDAGTGLHNFFIKNPNNGNNQYLTKNPNNTELMMTTKFSENTLAPFQTWFFEPVAMEVVGVQFNIKDMKPPTNTPHSVSQQTLVNNTDVEQTMTWTTKSAIVTESHFEHSVGIGIEVGVSFEIGIPLFASGTVEMSVSTNYSYSWGKSSETTQEWEEQFPVVVPAGKTVVAQAIILQAKMEVPYVMVLKDTRTGIIMESAGIWYGVDAYDIKYTLSNQ